MAIYNVQSNGNAPKEAKAGDTIVTAGGSYEVLDGSKYSGMSKEQLANAGVGYNPSSGLYSRKVSNVQTQDYSAMNRSVLDDWLTTANKNVQSQLDSAFEEDRANLYKAYNASRTDYENQIKDVRQNYLNNINQLYEDTYYNNNMALERASNRGLTNSGLGNAMVVSGLVDASNQNALYRSQRDTDVNKLNTIINSLTRDFNVDLNALKRKLNSDKAAALSGNEIQFMQALVELDRINTETYNNVLQAKLERDFQSAEAQKDRDFEKEMYLLQLANQRSYGGSYGGYGGGYRSYGGYSGGSSGVVSDAERAKQVVMRSADISYDGGEFPAGTYAYTVNQLNDIENLAKQVANGTTSLEKLTNRIAAYDFENTFDPYKYSSMSNKTSNSPSKSKAGRSQGLN